MEELWEGGKKKGGILPGDKDLFEVVKILVEKMNKISLGESPLEAEE